MRKRLNEYAPTGRVGGDAEVRVLTNGQEVMSFSLAIDRSYTKKGGDRVNDTEWVRCNLWGKNLNKLAQYVTKGALVQVSGVPKAEAWTDKKGSVQASLSLTLTDMAILHQKSAARASEDAPAQSDLPPEGGAQEDNFPF